MTTTTKKKQAKKEERKGYRIVELRAENVMRLKAVHLQPRTSTVVLEGRNKQGKTSVLCSIAAALGGEKLCPARPIREGEKEASVSVDLGEFTVTRKWTANDKSYLQVRHREGYPIGSPQVFLNKLLGGLAFDPMAFTTMEPAKRAELLRKITGLDFQAEKEIRAKAYDERREAKKELDRARKELKGLGEIPEGLAKVRPITEVQAEYDEAKAWNDSIETAGTIIENLKGEIQTAEK